MASKDATQASTAHMIAVLAMQLIREDPVLIVQLQKLAKTAEVPFDASRIDATVIELSEAAVTEVGARLLRHSGALSEFQLVVPRIDGGEMRSAAALAIGSFTTEYVHNDPERFAAFAEWMHASHKDATEGKEISRGSIEDADQILTLMAHVSTALVEREATRG
jgi:hypothetical protein